MDPDKVKALVENVNKLMENHHNQQRSTAELFKVCLEFLEDKGHGVYYTNADIQREGGVFNAAKAAGIKRRERKQQLIAAIKEYIEMIENRDKEKKK